MYSGSEQVSSINHQGAPTPGEDFSLKHLDGRGIPRLNERAQIFKRPDPVPTHGGIAQQYTKPLRAGEGLV